MEITKEDREVAADEGEHDEEDDEEQNNDECATIRVTSLSCDWLGHAPGRGLINLLQKGPCKRLKAIY